MKLILGSLPALLFLAAGFGCMLCMMAGESLVVGGTPAKLRWLEFAAMVVGVPLCGAVFCLVRLGKA